MKKTFLTFVLVASTFATSFGQYKVIDNGLVFDKFIQIVNHRGIGFYGQDNFIVRGYGKTLLINNQLTVSEKLKIKDKVVSVKGNTTFLGGINAFNNDGKIVEYSLFPYIEKENVVLAKKTLVGRGVDLDFKYEYFNFGGYKKGDYTIHFVAKSKDETRQVLLINVIALNYKFREVVYNYKESIVVVFDEEGKILWKKRVQLNFKQETFSILDCTVSNDGNVVYIASISSKNENKKDGTLEIKRIEEDDFANEEIIKNLDKKIIENAKIKILSNGNVFLGANYKEGKDAGFFSLTFPKNEPSDYLMTIVPYKNAKTDRRFIDFWTSENFPLLKDIYETSDGVVSMITEETFGNWNNTRDVVINSFNLQGEYQKTSVLFRKSAESYGTITLITVSVIDAKDKLLLIYNENKDNLSTNLPENAAFLAGGFKKNGVVTVCEVVGGIVGNKYKIMDGTTSNLMFSDVLYVKDKVAVLKTMSYNTLPLKFGVCKLTWE